MKKPELGRGERVIPGLWRLRLPLPYPGVPHGNAYAIADGSELVLVDCGPHLEGSMAGLELALAQVGLSLAQVNRLLITHAHADHWGQAKPVIDRTGAELWLSPNLDHAQAGVDSDAAIAQRMEMGLQSGVPERPLREFLERTRDMPSGIAAVLEPEYELADGVTIATDLGDLHAYQTPGHCQSHIAFYNPDHRLLISGDHLLGRVSPYFEFGFTPDPVGEFLNSLDVIEALDARLCVSGHGRPFTDVPAHIRGNRELVARRLDAAQAGLADMPLTALELVPAIYGEALTPQTAGWRLPETMSYLTHLQTLGVVTSDPDETTSAERWRLVV